VRSLAGRRRLPAALVAFGLVLSGCGLVGGDGDETEPDGRSAPTLPAAAAVLRVATTEWPSCLNPLTCTDPAARDLVWEHVLPRLVEVGPDGQHRPSPVLAGMPEVRVDEAGGQTITYVLDPDARWHDGRPITSSDVTATWLAHRATPGAPTDGYELIEGVDDRDPLVARVTLSAPYADWPELFGGHTGWLLQGDAFDGALDLTGRFDDGLGFGAGPFELATVSDRAIVLVAHDEHWDPDRQAATDQVRIERLPDDDLADLPGGIDLAWAPDATNVPDRLDAVPRPTTEVVGLFLDRRTPALGSEVVRRAVDEAIDRRTLLDELGGDDADLVTCLGHLPQHPSCGEDLTEDAGAGGAAEALLDGDGWVRDPSGPRGRPGEPLLVPISYDPVLPGAEAVAEAVAEALVPLGFGVVVQATDVATWRQADRGSVGIGVFAAPLGTAQRVASLARCDLGLNPLGWCEGPSQELAADLLSSVTAAERTAAIDELAELAAQVRSWLPLRQRTEVLLADPRRVEVPDEVPLGSGPLGGLHRFGRVDR